MIYSGVLRLKNSMMICLTTERRLARMARKAALVADLFGNMVQTARKGGWQGRLGKRRGDKWS